MKKRRILWMLAGIFVLFLSGCSENGSKYLGTYEAETLVQENAFTFSDGKSVDRYRGEEGSDCDIYQLEDGTRLLSVGDWTFSPEWLSYDPEVEDRYENWDETVQQKISAYFEAQGTLYDVEEELTRAYEVYKKCQEDNTAYDDTRSLSQEDIELTFSNEKILCFRTAAHVPIPGSQTTEGREIGVIFDRMTGETFSAWELFARPETEVKDLITKQLKDLESSLTPDDIKEEYFCFYPYYLSVHIPASERPGENTQSLGAVLNYQDFTDLFVPTLTRTEGTK